MKSWIDANRKKKSEDAADLEEFVTEREKIAPPVNGLSGSLFGRKV